MAPRPNLAIGNWTVVANNLAQIVTAASGRQTAITITTSGTAIPPDTTTRVQYSPPPFQVKARLDPSMETPAFSFLSPIQVI